MSALAEIRCKNQRNVDHVDSEISNLKRRNTYVEAPTSAFLARHLLQHNHVMYATPHTRLQVRCWSLVLSLSLGYLHSPHIIPYPVQDPSLAPSGPD